jgi:serine kinase of HPr protein (carbohydrate metabolism regulator)
MKIDNLKCSVVSTTYKCEKCNVCVLTTASYINIKLKKKGRGWAMCDLVDDGFLALIITHNTIDEYELVVFVHVQNFSILIFITRSSTTMSVIIIMCMLFKKSLS